MTFRFAQERQDYRDYAAGSVFHGLPGHPAFPVRLTSEILQRCLDVRARDGQSGPCSIYDPCCGGGYLLATLAYLHWRDIQAIYASDVNDRALDVAKRNLALLTPQGLQERIDQIEGMIRQFDKESHKEAYQSAERLKAQVIKSYPKHPIAMSTFHANIFADTLADHISAPVDLVITDIPYGSRSEWLGLPDDAPNEPSWHLLQSLLSILSSQSVVAIASNKQQKISHEQYRRVDHFQIGKRRVVLLKPLSK
jgi:23S rRNA (guanine2535-N1)-methyltransferase